MRQVMTELDTQTQAALAAIADAASLEALEEQRLAALGKKGWVSLALKTLGGMSPDERTAAAPAIQSARAAIADALDAKKAALEAAELEAQLARETIDLTLPAAAAPKGSVHPVSQVMDELAEIFADLGFAVATGPEIEDDWHNFTALNMDETHPARAMHDTFYFGENQITENFFRQGNISTTRFSPRLNTESVAAFGQLTFDLSDSLRLVAGADHRLWPPGGLWPAGRCPQSAARRVPVERLPADLSGHDRLQQSADGQ